MRTLTYVVLGIIVVICLVQSLRYRWLKWQERADNLDLKEAGRQVVRGVAGRDNMYDGMERAFLTGKGRDFRSKQILYDALGVGAAVAALILFLQDLDIA